MNNETFELPTFRRTPSEREYAIGAVVTVDYIRYEVIACLPTKHKGWWVLLLDYTNKEDFDNE